VTMPDLLVLIVAGLLAVVVLMLAEQVADL
jgi:hypothetical protein